MNLNGKVAIVTGAGRGLGRAAAITMARAGADLVIVSRTARELEETASVIMGGGGKVAAIEGDLARLARFLASPDSDGVTGEIGGPIDFVRFGYRGN